MLSGAATSGGIRKTARKKAKPKAAEQAYALVNGCVDQQPEVDERIAHPRLDERERRQQRAAPPRGRRASAPTSTPSRGPWRSPAGAAPARRRAAPPRGRRPARAARTGDSGTKRNTAGPSTSGSRKRNQKTDVGPERVDQQAAEQVADGAARARGADDGADRPRQELGAEEVAGDAVGQRGDAGAHTLQHAPEDGHADAVGERADQRAEREGRERRRAASGACRRCRRGGRPAGRRRSTRAGTPSPATRPPSATRRSAPRAGAARARRSTARGRSRARPA